MINPTAASTNTPRTTMRIKVVFFFVGADVDGTATGAGAGAGEKGALDSAGSGTAGFISTGGAGWITFVLDVSGSIASGTVLTAISGETGCSVGVPGCVFGSIISILPNLY
jgi:hypothetical protein